MEINPLPSSDGIHYSAVASISFSLCEKEMEEREKKKLILYSA